MGSSPRVRGRLLRVGVAAPVRWAHPRGCGADVTGFRAPLMWFGSSPRVRGRLLRQWFTSCTVGAHPRGCGADPIAGPIITSGAGSSPRVRGRQEFVLAAARAAGLIPAGAGQTAVPRHHHGSDGAHPRGCGADRRLTASWTRGLGSSPRVRGRRGSGGGHRRRPGLIPAGAGQTEG